MIPCFSAIQESPLSMTPLLRYLCIRLTTLPSLMVRLSISMSFVTHGVKEAFKVNYIFVAFIDYLLYFPKRVQTSPSRTEAETSLGELGLIDYRQHLVDGLLHHTVNHSGYAQQAHLAALLGYLYPSYRIRTICRCP